MEIKNRKILDTDILIIGGGTAGCYAALTIAEQSDAKVIIAEKANIKRSGCLAAGVNAINAYIVEGRKPEDYVDYAKKGCRRHRKRGFASYHVGGLKPGNRENGEAWSCHFKG